MTNGMSMKVPGDYEDERMVTELTDYECRPVSLESALKQVDTIFTAIVATTPIAAGSGE